MLLIAVPLAIGLMLVAMAFVSALASLLLLLPGDERVQVAGIDALFDGRRTEVDPNEAARAAGSWG